MFTKVILLAVLAATLVEGRPGLIYTQPLQPLGVEYVDPNERVKAHPSVEINAASEALLPRELLKSKDFYDNPAIAEGLAKESWFTNKEMLVLARETEKIPREKIYHMVKSAGFLDQYQ